MLTQSHYIKKFLNKYGHYDEKPAPTPLYHSIKLEKNIERIISQLEYSTIIESLMYVMHCTRPDITHTINVLCCFTSNPGTEHWKAISRVLTYLEGTINYGLSYKKYSTVLEGYSDCLK